jgi:hypothetical protein
LDRLPRKMSDHLIVLFVLTRKNGRPLGKKLEIEPNLAGSRNEVSPLA